ncbi:MAG TPA: hypothetical protein VFV23_11070 [Verrucomicrobiae bacterium]|nr:hypothetical protein [Verrucomicrobiae bacterium]
MPVAVAAVSRVDRNGPSDLSHWILALRASGAPLNILVAVAQADFDARWQQKNAAMQRAYAAGEVDDDALAVFTMERDGEADHELQAALGDADFQKWDHAKQLAMLDMKGIVLSADETNALYHLQRTLRLQTRELELARRKREIDSAQFEKERDALQAEYNQQLQQLLGYQRYSNFTGTGLTADERHELKHLDLDENQMSAIEKVEIEFSEKQAALAKEAADGELNPADLNAQMQALGDWKQQEYEQTLGADAFSAYQKQQDSRYVDMENYRNQWQMSDQDIDRVYAFLKNYDAAQQAYQQQISGLKAQGDIDGQHQLSNSWQEFSNQTAQNVLQYLGPDRFDVLKENRILPF